MTLSRRSSGLRASPSHQALGRVRLPIRFSLTQGECRVVRDAPEPRRCVELKSYLRRGHVVIERVEPVVDCGLYRAKAIVGDVVDVTADIFRDGPDLLQAVVRYRGPGTSRWSESPMELVDNDRWRGRFRPVDIGVWEFTIEAWTDRFATWRRDLIKRVDAGQVVDLELAEGALMVADRLRAFPASDRAHAKGAVAAMRLPAPAPGSLEKVAPGTSVDDPRIRAALDERIAELMAAHHTRAGSTTMKPAYELLVERERARFGSWYELFPRSTGTATKHGTFRTAAKALARVADLGFDVVYLPPIHPIGTTFRKGPNNSLDVGRDDVGVPWAIGDSSGGHTAVHPDLGTMEDFDAFVAEASRFGLEVCLDFAIQASPDHPWVTEHPEWFRHRPDGSIRYAENPPKKYQDIYPINFDTEDRAGLWTELKGILDLWIGHGVRIFRVDNPHTKAFPFWEWLIDAIHDQHPDVIFLAEAFTRPKVMASLAKIGFTQSYTYFTWRNTKPELIEYLTELTRSEMAKYFRPNFFANTPDILHEYLQTGGKPAFKVRLVLAAMMSPTYGIYSGFELFENTPVRPGSEEYLDSEKYQLRARDFEGSDNLNAYIKRINEIRRSFSSLARHTNLRFHQTDKDAMIAFSKSLPDEDPILVVVNLNPFHWEETTLDLDLEALGLESWQTLKVADLITGDTYEWQGAHNYVRLDPYDEPAHIFQVKR